MVKPNSVLSITLLGVGNKPQGHWFVDGTVDYPFPFSSRYIISNYSTICQIVFITKIGRVVFLLPKLNRAYETP